MMLSVIQIVWRRKKECLIVKDVERSDRRRFRHLDGRTEENNEKPQSG
jgi:hypothetical protein